MIEEIKIFTDDNFESCDDCIYSDDAEEICYKRGCIHAIDEINIRECYTQRKEKNILDKVKKVRDEILYKVDRYNGTGEEYLLAYCRGAKFCLNLLDALIESEEKE